MAREDKLRRALFVERNVLRHRSVRAYAPHGDAERFQRMLDAVDDGGGFEAAMHHAVGAFLVIADAVGVPVGLFHQRFEGFGIPFAEEIAGPWPAEYGAGRIAPRRTMIGLIAGKEIEEHGGLAEGPALATLAARENPPEEILGLLAIEEVLLV